MAAQKVNVDSFGRAETRRVFADLQRDAGGVNRCEHAREPAPIERQTVIRMNRDTLHTLAIIDISAGGTLTVPDAVRPLPVGDGGRRGSLQQPRLPRPRSL
jgi:hypothetical protein